MESVVELLQDLVQIPSVNPDGDPGVSPGGEKEVADLVSEFLEPYGFDSVFEEVEPGRPNLIARAPGSRNRPRILLGPHLDTVGVSGMTIDPFSGSISDGKIYGRGSFRYQRAHGCNAMGTSRKCPPSRKPPNSSRFCWLHGRGIETARVPTTLLKTTHTQYDFAVAGEPTALEAVYCTKGCLWATVKATGKATHASQPHLGENAILKLLRELQGLEGSFLKHLSGFPTSRSGSINHECRYDLGRDPRKYRAGTGYCYP